MSRVQALESSTHQVNLQHQVVLAAFFDPPLLISLPFPPPPFPFLMQPQNEQLKMEYMSLQKAHNEEYNRRASGARAAQDHPIEQRGSVLSYPSSSCPPPPPCFLPRPYFTHRGDPCAEKHQREDSDGRAEQVLHGAPTPLALPADI
eukprot:767976-Hanusia_phi.AAC.2